jgi:hypothetical protein
MQKLSNTKMGLKKIQNEDNEWIQLVLNNMGASPHVHNEDTRGSIKAGKFN